MQTQQIHRSEDREAGFILVFFAISVVALMIFAALVINGSQGAQNRREMQTAADNSSMAGTAELRRQKASGVPSFAEVLAKVREVAVENGADPADVTCEVVTADYSLDPDPANVIGPCDGVNEGHAEAAGIRVAVSETDDTAFQGVSSQAEMTARAAAAATAQPLANGVAPFLICSPAAGHPVPVLDAGGNVNPAAVGEEYVLWGNEIKEEGRDCGNSSSSWRGLVNFDDGQGYSAPGWWTVKTGNSSGQLPRLLSSPHACSLADGESVEDLEIGCELVIPLCTHGNGETGSNWQAYCVRFGTFRILRTKNANPYNACAYATHNNTICAEFLGGATVASGSGVAATPDYNEAVVIKLVD